MNGTPLIFERVRSSCAAVADVAQHVRIDAAEIARFAVRLDRMLADRVVATGDPAQDRHGDDEATAAFTIALDAINFGSGYFPTLAKRPGLSGYRTVAASLHDYVSAAGPLSADRLAALSVEEVATIFGQSLDEPGPAELMHLFTDAWHDLARHVDARGAGRFVDMITTADASAAALVEQLMTMPFFRDVHHHPDAGEVLLLKRAQIVVQDLHHAFDGAGPGRFVDRSELTMFPDNLVPHVLRVEGVLHLAPDLVARIEAVDDIRVGSPEEIEIRACGLHAVELLRDALAERGRSLTAADLDNVLWTLGGDPVYKAIPRHRSRSVYY